MSHLNELELQNIRHFIGGHQTMAAKLTQYANSCNDQEIKQMFFKAAQDAQSSVQRLANLLS